MDKKTQYLLKVPYMGPSELSEVEERSAIIKNK